MTIWTGHDARHVIDVDVVTVSTAVEPANGELDAARRAGVVVAGRPDIMEALARGQRTLAVSGTHGKTTTSAMAALVARAVGWDPSFIIGGVVHQLGTGARWTGSGRFVVEADESDSSFLRFGAEDVIVTNIEADHLDHHGSMEALERAFDRFVTQGTGVKVLCADDPGTVALHARVAPVTQGALWTYGTADGADYRIVGLSTSGMRTAFSVQWGGSVIAELDLQVPGDHNARNATAVLAAFHALGSDPATVSRMLNEFAGVCRRFEYRGEARGVTFVDDYAHLPSEVATVVSAAAKGDWTRVIAVFEPHRYTRIRDVGADFADSFLGAAVVVVVPLFAAGQTPIAGISSRTVSDAVRAAHPELEVLDVADRRSLVDLLSAMLRPGDLCLTMNAGDLTTLPHDMLTGGWAARPLGDAR